MIDLYTVPGSDRFRSVRIPEFCFSFYIRLIYSFFATNLRRGPRDASEKKSEKKSLVVSDYYVSYQNRSIINSVGYAEVERKKRGDEPPPATRVAPQTNGLVVVCRSI